MEIVHNPETDVWCTSRRTETKKGARNLEAAWAQNKCHFRKMDRHSKKSKELSGQKKNEEI